jgi:hypothetical protein
MVGEWKDGAIGDKILSEGRPVSSVCVAIRGAIRVHGRGRDLGLLEPGHLIGTAVALTGKASPVDAAFA